MKFTTHIKDVNNKNYMVIKYDFYEIEKYINLYISNNSIFEISEHLSNQFIRDGSMYHITILSVSELSKIGKNDTFIINDIKMLGIGKCIDIKNGNEAIYIVVESEQLNRIRSEYGLKPKEFHITIGFNKKDVFNSSKNKETIIYEI